jgi:orotidine-5'-phosphate decarboxylase
MNPIYLAIDTADAAVARRLIDDVRDSIGGVKIGLTFWFANGPTVVGDVVTGLDWFLDIKLHDIPTQVAGAIRAVLPLAPTYISLHEKGGRAMMEAAVEAANIGAQAAGIARPRILAVTTLTSLPATITGVVRQAHHAISCGLDGVIASPQEVKHLRAELGTKPVLMTPGIRTPDAAQDDHARSATPREAIEAGANLLVIGRPITQAAKPRDAAQAIISSLA